MDKTEGRGAQPLAPAPRVFIVEVSFSVPVLAESAEEAERLAESEYAEDEWREGGGSFSADYAAWELRKAGAWAKCLPWGGDGETTIDKLVAEPARSDSKAAPHE